MKLADLQALFQGDILKGGDGILTHIPDSPKESKETLFSVYRDAYVLRLVGILREDFERLHTYIGDEAFDELVRGYIAAHPSHTPNARWYGQQMPAYVASLARFEEQPIVAALARLEGALNDVFDCADVPAMQKEDLAAFAPEDFERLVFKPHPSARWFNTAVDVGAIWSALAKEETPPAVEACDPPQTLIVWRRDLTPHYRVLGREEAMMWAEMEKGVRFGILCEMLATFDDPENAALRAAQYLQNWIADGMLEKASAA